jgi:hypothetical protein
VFVVVPRAEQSLLTSRGVTAKHGHVGAASHVQFSRGLALEHLWVVHQNNEMVVIGIVTVCVLVLSRMNIDAASCLPTIESQFGRVLAIH